MHPNEPFSPILAALTGPGYLGLIVAAFVAPFRMQGSWLRFAPLGTITAWLLVAFTPLAAAGVAPLLGLLVAVWTIFEAACFFRLRTRFGLMIGICCVLFAIGSINICGPYLYVRFSTPVQQASLSNH